MNDPLFGMQFATRFAARVGARLPLQEDCGPGGTPLLELVNTTDGSPAGFLRRWSVAGAPQVDRVIHFRLISAPVDTHLLFVFGCADTAVPHFHGQVVQFGPDACVYNADIIPRLDPVDHPAYFREVYGPVTRAYWKATTDTKNVCAMAPANPAIAAYLSPWSIAAGRPTTREELERVQPSIDHYIDHVLTLATGMAYPAPPGPQMRERDRRHMGELHSDELDPRAWKGVYRVIGDAMGQTVKEILAQPLR